MLTIEIEKVQAGPEAAYVDADLARFSRLAIERHRAYLEGLAVSLRRETEDQRAKGKFRNVARSAKSLASTLARLDRAELYPQDDPYMHRVTMETIAREEMRSLGLLK